MARKTLIYIEEIEGELYPSENIYPADNMYPNLGTLIIGEVTGVNYTGIVSGSLALNELLMDNELTIGKCCSNKFEVELYNVRSDLSKHKISVIQRIDDRQIDVFTGIIESSEKNDDGITRKITAYDIYYFKKDLDVASWWNPLFDDEAKHTIKELREGLLTYLGIPFSKVNLPNDNVQFDNTTLFNSITADTLLTLLCEFSGVTPNINRSGVMEFLYLGTTQKDLTDLYEKNTSTFEDYTTADITGIQLYGDSNSVAQIVGTEDNSFAISSNALMLTKSASELDTILNNIFDTLKSIKYVPSEVHMIESDWNIHLGDKVSTEHGIHYVMELDFSGSIFIEQTLKSVAKGETLENSPSNSRDLMAFDGKISKVEKNIDGLTVEFSDAIKATNAKIDVTAEQIKTEVKETYSTKDETQEIKKDLNSSIEQSASSILATVEKTYSTKTEAQNLETALKLYADSASLSAAGTVSSKVDNVQKTLQASIDLKLNTKDLVSEINASADIITLKGNRISITSSNSSWDKDGTVKFTKGTIGQWNISNVLSSTQDAYISPGLSQFETIRNAILNGTTSSLSTSLYDFNGDNIVDLTDFVYVKNYLLGRREFNSSNSSIAKTSKVTTQLNPTNPVKAFYVSGTDMWGTQRETYLGINGLKTERVNTESINATCITLQDGEVHKTMPRIETGEISRQGTGNWINVVINFSPSYTEIPIFSVMPTVGTSTENVMLNSITKTSANISMYCPNTNWTYKIMWFSIGY